MDRYEEVARLLYHLCHKFQRSYGGEFDDWLSEAHEAFVLAAQSYRTEKGAFASWISFKVQKALLSRLRSLPPTAVSLDLDLPGSVDYWRRMVFELSPTARIAVNYALAATQNSLDRRRMYVIRSMIEDGYPREAIVNSFDEIRRILR